MESPRLQALDKLFEIGASVAGLERNGLFLALVQQTFKLFLAAGNSLGAANVPKIAMC